MKISEIHNKDSNDEIHVCALVYPENNSRQLSMVDGNALLKARKQPGLCTGRFDADIITEGLDYKTLLPGSRLVIGDTEIEISTAEKRCFDDCIIHRSGDSCTLPQNCAFARVINGGVIKAGMCISQRTVE